MSINIERASHHTLQFVLDNLRNVDHEELSATAYGDPTEKLADQIMQWHLMAFVASDDRVPISAWGLMPLWPHVGAAFAFGTPEWGRAVLAMTQHIKRFMLPLLRQQGYHRIEARSLASRQDSARWLTLLGAEPEAVLRGCGKSGEDFVLYRWLDERRQARSEGQADARH